MTKLRYYVLLVLLLLAVNGFIIGKIFLWSSPAHREPREVIIERLQLDEEQVKRYDQLITDHRNAIRQKDRALRDMKDSLYMHLRETDTDFAPDSLIARINNVQRDIEFIHYRHFQDIRTLCRPEQYPAFSNLVAELGELFSNKRPPHR